MFSFYISIWKQALQCIWFKSFHELAFKCNIISKFCCINGTIYSCFSFYFSFCILFFFYLLSFYFWIFSFTPSLSVSLSFPPLHAPLPQENGFVGEWEIRWDQKEKKKHEKRGFVIRFFPLLHYSSFIVWFCFFTTVSFFPFVRRPLRRQRSSEASSLRRDALL